MSGTIPNNPSDQVFGASTPPAPPPDPAAADARRWRGENADEISRESAEPSSWPWVTDSASMLGQAAVFGLIFGFLLQKGGVAKFDILVGVLLLETFVVVQVMLSAIIIGMIGVYVLGRKGLIEPQIPETKLGANIFGGLIFGIGFGLIAYCPGTGAAALGQGNWDALVGIIGLLLGSYLFAVVSHYTRGFTSPWGSLGKITLAELARQPTGVFIAMFLPWLIIVLLALELISVG